MLQGIPYNQLRRHVRLDSLSRRNEIGSQVADVTEVARDGRNPILEDLVHRLIIIDEDADILPQDILFDAAHLDEIEEHGMLDDQISCLFIDIFLIEERDDLVREIVIDAELLEISLRADGVLGVLRIDQDDLAIFGQEVVSADQAVVKRMGEILAYIGEALLLEFAEVEQQYLAGIEDVEHFGIHVILVVHDKIGVVAAGALLDQAVEPFLTVLMEVQIHLAVGRKVLLQGIEKLIFVGAVCIQEKEYPADRIRDIIPLHGRRVDHAQGLQFIIRLEDRIPGHLETLAGLIDGRQDITLLVDFRRNCLTDDPDDLSGLCDLIIELHLVRFFDSFSQIYLK